MSDKIESIKKVDKSMENPSINEIDQMEQGAAEKEQFQNLMGQSDVQAANYKKMGSTWVKESQLVDGPSKPELEKTDAERVGITNIDPNPDQKGDQQKKGQGNSGEVEGISGKGSTAKSEALMDQMGEIRGQMKNIADLRPEDIKAQAKELNSKLETLKKSLASSKEEIKPAYHKVLEHRLSHIDDNLKIALSKVGVESEATSAAPTTERNPTKRFISMLTDSQKQIDSLHNSMEMLEMQEGSLSPATMLTLQIKVNQVQHQIELFTGLLSKALDSVKQVMNVQV